MIDRNTMPVMRMGIVGANYYILPLVRIFQYALPRMVRFQGTATAVKMQATGRSLP